MIGGRLARRGSVRFQGESLALEYVARAVRRFWPVVLLSLALGVLAGLYLRPDLTTRYASNALMLVVPAAESGFGDVPGDRYISSQLVVLESPPMAARASELAALGISDDEIAQSVVFFQIPGTDVVRIMASSGSPGDAQVIANAYLDAYVERTRSAGETAVESDPTALDDLIAEVEQQINEIEQRISDALAPIQETGLADGQEVPTIEEVEPALAIERDVYLEKYGELLRRRSAVEFELQEVTGGQIIQRAELPTTPNPQSSPLFVVAIPIAAVLLGVGLATVLGRASRRVLDGTEVTEVLGIPFAAAVPRRRLPDRPIWQLRHLSDKVRDVVNELCVQALAHGSTGQPLTVLVTGSQRVSGTTSLAALMAARFGELGSRVALVDLDFDHPELAEFFDVHADGFSALLSDGGLRSGSFDGLLEASIFTSTSIPNVSVVGRSRRVGQSRPQSADLLVALDKVVRYADVVVFDAGPMLVASASAVLCQHTDAVVLAVPVWAQQRAPLRVVSRQLDSVKTHLLPVLMPRLTSLRDRQSTAPTQVATTNEVDVASQGVV